MYRFFLLVRDDYCIFARKGVIFHSSTGVLPLFGLLKGLLVVFSGCYNQSFLRHCLHTPLVPASLRAGHRAIGLSIPPSEGTGVLSCTHLIGERHKKGGK